MTQNINNLLNDESKKYQGATIITLAVDEIEANPENTAPIVNIELLADQITQDGLIRPIQVYKIGNHQYRLLDGERRWTAHKHLGLEEIRAIIVPKPASIEDEIIFIDGANDQRPDTKEYRLLRVDSLSKAYDGKKARNEIPTGMLKRDWISMRMNNRLTGRAIQNYLSELNDTDSDPSDKNSEEQTVSLKKITKTMMKLMKEIENVDWDSIDVESNKDTKEFQEFRSVQKDLDDVLVKNVSVNVYRVSKKFIKE